MRIQVIPLNEKGYWRIFVYFEEGCLVPQFLKLSRFLKPMVLEYLECDWDWVCSSNRTSFRLRGDLHSTAPKSQEIHPFRKRPDDRPPAAGELIVPLFWFLEL